MAPRTWHGDDHQAFFKEYMPQFIQRQAQKKLYKFWGPMFEAWFALFPEQKFLGWLVGDGAPPLSHEEVDALGKAISKRKQASRMLENYFRNNRAKLDAGAAKKHQSLYALSKALFKAKPQRKRLHKAVELFQLRNPRLITEECSREGLDSINEASMAAAVANWVNESDDEQVARIKAAQAARMRLRNRVVHALFAEASEEELEAIAELMEKEKAGELVIDEDDEGMPVRSAAEYQASIDESWDVMKKVHAAIEKMTGWYGFSIWGGPNPRIGGELSMKSVSFGLAPSGLDFEATHADFEKAVELPFQLFLRRCFPPELRAKRSLDAVIPESPSAEDVQTVDAGFRLPNDDELPKARPKRMRKSKKTVEKAAKTASIRPIIQTPIPAVLPARQPTSPLSHPPASPVARPNTSTSMVAPTYAPDTTVSQHSTLDSYSSVANGHPAVLGTSCGSELFPDDLLAQMDDFLGGGDFGMEDDGMSGGMEERDSVGMPPLPSASTRWDTAPIEGMEGVAFPAASTDAMSATNNVITSNLAAPANDPHSRINGLFADYRRITEDSPTRNLNLFNLGNTSFQFHPASAPRESTALEGSSPVPARFRRSWDSSPIAAPLQWGTPDSTPGRLPALALMAPRGPIGYPTAAAASALLTSEITHPVFIAPTTTEAPTQPPSSTPLTALPPARRQPVIPQSRPEANVPKPPAEAAKPGAKKAKPRPKPKTKPAPKKATGQAGAAAQAKTAAKVAGKKNAGGKRGKAAAAAGSDGDVGEGIVDPDTGVLADTSNTSVDTSNAPIYTMTNNTIKFDREVRARQAAVTAANKARVVPNLLHNPDGPTDLVIPATNPDNTAVALPVKRTLAEMRQMSNLRTENALLERTGRLPAASSGATRCAKRGRGRARTTG